MKKSGWDTASGKKTEVDREWIGYTKEGKPYQKPRCWNEPYGCKMFFDSFNFDYEHNLCKQCVRGLEANWGVSQTMVGCLLACMRLDSHATARIWAVTKNKEYMDQWATLYESRIRYLLNQLAVKPWEQPMARWEKLSISYFRAALNKAGITETQGKGIQPV